MLLQCRNSGQASEEYQEVKVLCKKFDEVFDQCMDIIRGLGGSIDLGHLQHGAHWSEKYLRTFPADFLLYHAFVAFLLVHVHTT